MIDGIDLTLIDTDVIRNIENHPLVHFSSLVDMRTGQERSHRKAKYRDLRFELRHQGFPRLRIRGSLPRYSRGTNFTSITFNEVKFGLDELCTEFGLKPANISIDKIEIGVSLEMPARWPVHRLISSILVYKGKLPTRLNYDNRGSMILFDLTEFGIKIYDKGAQANKDYNAMRFELLLNRRSQLTKMGINNLSDLYGRKIMITLQKRLLNVIKQLVFVDLPASFEKLSRRDLTSLLNAQRGDFWRRLMEDNPELYRKRKHSIRRLMQKIHGASFNDVLYHLVEEETMTLIN